MMNSRMEGGSGATNTEEHAKTSFTSFPEEELDKKINELDVTLRSYDLGKRKRVFDTFDDWIPDIESTTLTIEDVIDKFDAPHIKISHHEVLKWLSKDGLASLFGTNKRLRSLKYFLAWKCEPVIEINSLASLTVAENVTSIHHKGENGVVLNYVEPIRRNWYNSGNDELLTFYNISDSNDTHFVAWRFNSLQTTNVEKLTEYTHMHPKVLEIENSPDSVTEGTRTERSMEILENLRNFCKVIFKDIYGEEATSVFDTLANDCGWFVNDDMPFENILLETDCKNSKGVLKVARRYQYGNFDLNYCKNHHYRLAAYNKRHDEAFIKTNANDVDFGPLAMTCSTKMLFDLKGKDEISESESYLCQDCKWNHWLDKEKLLDSHLYGVALFPTCRCEKHKVETIPAFCKKNESLGNYVKLISGMTFTFRYGNNITVRSFLGLPKNDEWLKQQAIEMFQRQQMLNEQSRRHYITKYLKQQVYDQEKLSKYISSEEEKRVLEELVNEYCCVMEQHYDQKAFYGLLRGHLNPQVHSDINPTNNTIRMWNQLNSSHSNRVPSCFVARGFSLAGRNKLPMLKIFNNPFLLHWYINLLPFDIFNVNNNYKLGLLKDIFTPNSKNACANERLFLFFVQIKGKKIVFVDNHNISEHGEEERVLDTSYTTRTVGGCTQLIVALLVASKIPKDEVHSNRNSSLTTDIKVKLYRVQLSEDIDSLIEKMPYNIYTFPAKFINEVFLSRNDPYKFQNLFPTPFQIRCINNKIEFCYVTVEGKTRSRYRYNDQSLSENVSCINFYSMHALYLQVPSLYNCQSYFNIDEEITKLTENGKKKFKFHLMGHTWIKDRTREDHEGWQTTYPKVRRDAYQPVSRIYKNTLTDFIHDYFIQHIEKHHQENTFFKEIYCSDCSSSPRRPFFVHDVLTVLENGLQDGSNGELQIIVQPIGNINDSGNHSMLEGQGGYKFGKSELLPTFFLTLHTLLEDTNIRDIKMIYDGTHRRIKYRNHELKLKEYDNTIRRKLRDPKLTMPQHFQGMDVDIRTRRRKMNEIVENLTRLVSKKTRSLYDIYAAAGNTGPSDSDPVDFSTITASIIKDICNSDYSLEEEVKVENKINAWVKDLWLAYASNHADLGRNQVLGHEVSIKKRIRDMLENLRAQGTEQEIIDQFREDSLLEIPNARNLHYEFMHGSFRFSSLPNIAFTQNSKYGTLCYMPHWPTLSTLKTGDIVCLRNVEHELKICNKNFPKKPYEKQWFRRGYIPVQVIMEGEPRSDAYFTQRTNTKPKALPLHVTAAVNYYPFKSENNINPKLNLLSVLQSRKESST